MKKILGQITTITIFSLVIASQSGFAAGRCQFHFSPETTHDQKLRIILQHFGPTKTKLQNELWATEAILSVLKPVDQKQATLDQIATLKNTAIADILSQLEVRDQKQEKTTLEATATEAVLKSMDQKQTTQDQIATLETRVKEIQEKLHQILLDILNARIEWQVY